MVAIDKGKDRISIYYAVLLVKAKENGVDRTRYREFYLGTKSSADSVRKEIRKLQEELETKGVRDYPGPDDTTQEFLNGGDYPMYDYSNN